MSREVINVGAAPNDGQGDPIRTSFIKTNNNFDELYARAQENPPGTLIGSVGDFAGMYAYDSTYFYYCYQDYDGSSIIWAKITNDALANLNQISNGTSSVNIPIANGNVTVSVANIANVAVFTSSGAIINGDLTVTGNANLSGNIVGDRIVNGSTAIEIPVTNGNATVSVANIPNVAIFTSTGLVANVISATGNIQAPNLVGGNLISSGIVTVTGNITGGNIMTAGSISAVGNASVANLFISTEGRIRADFTTIPVWSGQRTVFQTTSNTANAQTIVAAIPGDTNGNALGAAFTTWADTDLANSTTFGIFAYATENQLNSYAFGTSTLNPITIVFDTSETARFTPGGNLGLGNANPVDRLSVQGNAYVSGNVTSGNVITSGVVSAGTLTVNGVSTFAGNLMPAANITYNLGNSTNRWNDIWLANSTIYLGNAQVSANASAINLLTPSGGLISIGGTDANLLTSGTITGGNITTGGGMTATGNIFSNGIFIGNGSGLTGVVAVGNVGAASQLTNGSTALNIPVSGGNIIGNIGGSVNLFEFSTVGMSAAGNVTANNISAGNLITGAQLSVSGNITSSGTFVGDGSGLVNVIANVGSASQLTSGTTQINIPVANGNIVANVAGSTNLFQWSTVGFSAQGNVTGGNINTAGLVTATGNVTGGNLVTGGLATVTGNITGGNINTAGLVTATGNVTGGNLVTGGLATVTGNITGGNVLTAGVISATGNVTGDNLSGTNITGTLITAAQTNITSVGTLTSLNSGAISSSGNVTGANINTGGLITATGNVTGGNLRTTGLISATGNVTGDFLLGNGSQLTGMYGNANVVANLAALSSNPISTTGNITAGNLSVNTGAVSVGSIVNNNANGVGNIGTTTTRFNTVFALASSAQYADLAEYYLADHAYPAGTVVAFGGTQELTLCDNDHDVAVAGIISHKPAFEMNAGIIGEHPVALALAGRVPCQVVGTVRRGQMLVSAGSGRARAEANPRMGAVIGKALQDFDGTTGTIEVVVGRL